MKDRTLIMLERPDGGNIVASLSYSVMAFFVLPFILLLLMQGSFHNQAITAGMEIAFHVINFLASVLIFGGYLREGLQNFRFDPVPVLKAVLLYSLLALFVAAVFFFLGWLLRPEWQFLLSFGALPLAEMELFTLSANLLSMSPIWGALCLILLAPVTSACLYHSTVFCPIANSRPLLAYLIMALYLALPRLVNALTFMRPTEELILYLIQLPIHLLACRTYHRSDCVWGAILTLMLSNLIAFLLLLGASFLLRM